MHHWLFALGKIVPVLVWPDSGVIGKKPDHYISAWLLHPAKRESEFLSANPKVIPFRQRVDSDSSIQPQNKRNLFISFLGLHLAKWISLLLCGDMVFFCRGSRSDTGIMGRTTAHLFCHKSRGDASVVKICEQSNCPMSLPVLLNAQQGHPLHTNY